MKQKEMAEMVLAMLTREQMLHGFVENGLLTPAVQAMDNETLAQEVAKNLLNDLEGSPN